MLKAEKANANFIVFRLTQQALEHTIYHVEDPTGALTHNLPRRGEHANHYTTDAFVHRTTNYDNVGHK